MDKIQYVDSIMTDTETPAHVQAAIKKCSEINQNPHRWAEMEVVPTKNGSVVRVDWGHIRYDGLHETAIQTLSFTLDSWGLVHVAEHTHS